MTINLADNDPRIEYTVADGNSQQVFTVPFEFFDDADLNVYQDGTLKTLTTHYITADDNDVNDPTAHTSGTTGFIHFTAGNIPTASGADIKIVITRSIDIERTTDFPSSGPFDVASLNTALDKVIAIQADLQDDISRSLRLTDFDLDATLTLPDVDSRKGKVLAFNASTGAVESGPTISDTQTVANASADIATLADIEDGTDATDAIQTVAGISGNVTTVAGISSNVTTVAGISSDVTAVAGDATDIGTVASNIADVNTVATNIADVVTVANDLNEAISEIETAADDLNEAVSEIDTVATNIANVNKVGAIDTDVTTVAGIDSDVTTVAGISANVTTVAGIDSDVTTVSGISADVTTVAADGADIGTVAGISSDVTTVAGVSSNVTTVAGISANVTTVAGIDSDVSSVAGVSSDVTTVAGISADVTTVAADGTDIGTVATSISNVNTVAGNNANINTVAGISSNVTTVAGIASDVTAVAGDATDIGTVATDLAGSNNIGTVAGAISNVNAVGTDIANVNTTAANIAGVNSFAERYRVGASDPTTSLDEGDLAYNSTDNALKYYNGTAWTSITAGLTDIVADVTPQLGGDLDTNGNDINFGDNDKAIFGAGNDLEIYHDTNNSRILDSGTGDLYIGGDNTVHIVNAGVSSTKAQFITGGAVNLYYDNSLKFATTNTGIDVTGNATFDDNGKAIFGAGSDLEIYHDGTGSVINEAGTGNLTINSNGTTINFTKGFGETLASFNGDSDVELYYDNSKKFETTSYGTLFYGNSKWGDNGKAVFGAGDDLQIYHDGSNSLIEDVGTGPLRIRASGVSIENAAGTETLGNLSENGAVTLYYDGSAKLATTSTGISVTGSVTASSDLRLKENVERITDALSKVNELEGVTFDWKDGSGSSAGVIAQQVMAVMPSSVDTSDAEHLRVNYDSLIGLLIEAIKEQGKRIEALEQG